MKYLNQHLLAIKNQIKKTGGCILFLDFDGTISPIVKTPNKAYLPQKTKQDIKNCLAIFPVVIVSGRGLSDIKKKVGVKGLIYAGNHGLEWQAGKKKYSSKVSLKTVNFLKKIKQKIEKFIDNYPGALIENKKLSLSIHYRMVEKSQLEKFKKDIKKATDHFAQKDLSFRDDKKTFELRPKLGWTKGDFVDFILRQLQTKEKKNLLPIYIGDAKTDEDVFSRFKNAVTIRVGKNKKSEAKYYIKNQKQTDGFIEWLVENKS